MHFAWYHRWNILYNIVIIHHVIVNATVKVVYIRTKDTRGVTGSTPSVSICKCILSIKLDFYSSSFFMATTLEPIQTPVFNMAHESLSCACDIFQSVHVAMLHKLTRLMLHSCISNMSFMIVKEWSHCIDQRHVIINKIVSFCFMCRMHFLFLLLHSVLPPIYLCTDLKMIAIDINIFYASFDRFVEQTFTVFIAWCREPIWH